jgi:hypothetical protein
VVKAPSTNIQAPENIQTSTFNQREVLSNEFKFWELGGSLDVGAWTLGASATDNFTAPFPIHCTA